MRRAVWAVDIQPDDPRWFRKIQSAAEVLEALLPVHEIYPVHIVPPDGLAWNNESAHERSEAIGPIALEALKWVREQASHIANIKHLHQPLVAECRSRFLRNTTRVAATKLACWVRKLDAEVIVLNYEPTSPVLRPFTTNFAEAVLANSQVPSIFVGPNCRLKGKQISDVVIPTNFTDECIKTFAASLGWARSLKANLKLFYKHEPRPGPAITSAALLIGGVSEVAPIAVDEQFQGAHVNAWLHQAAHLGVRAEFNADETPLGTSEAILNYLKPLENPLLVMSACLGPLEAGLWGSVTRDVMSQSFAPVLVLRA